MKAALRKNEGPAPNPDIDFELRARNFFLESFGMAGFGYTCHLLSFAGNEIYIHLTNSEGNDIPEDISEEWMIGIRCEMTFGNEEAFSEGVKVPDFAALLDHIDRLMTISPPIRKARRSPPPCLICGAYGSHDPGCMAKKGRAKK